MWRCCLVPSSRFADGDRQTLPWIPLICSVLREGGTTRTWGHSEWRRRHCQLSTLCDSKQTATKSKTNKKIFEQTQMENFATLMGWEGLFSHKANFPVFYYILKLLVREYIIFHKTVKKGLKSLTLLKFVSTVLFWNKSISHVHILDFHGRR